MSAGPSNVQHSNIHSTQAENDEVEKELQAELEKAEATLTRVTAAFEGARACMLSYA